MTRRGVELCARFSLATNRLRYCGPGGADEALANSILEGRDIESSALLLAQFEALEPYLTAIAAKHGADLFDEDVVEAYWIGNGLLESFTRADFRGILARLHERGLPRRIVDRLVENLPSHPLPHHAFHVAFVGVGAVTGHVETSLENMERCRPSWARVSGIQGDRLTVEGPMLTLEAGRPVLRPSAPRSVPFDARFLPHLATGDSIAIHWDWPALVLSPDRLARLERYTRESLDAANEASIPSDIR